MVTCECGVAMTTATEAKKHMAEHPEWKVKPDDRIVHILRAGAALCGNVTGNPDQWPKGHLWVDPTVWRAATCEACISLFKVSRTSRP